MCILAPVYPWPASHSISADFLIPRRTLVNLIMAVIIYIMGKNFSCGRLHAG